ncbi:MAG TPA: hypothetical protein VGO62_07470, partial [Myxococcota bacterium]
MSSRVVLFLCSLTFAAASCTCGGAPGVHKTPDAGPGAPPANGPLCVRTDALDEPRNCTLDDDCACGAHCSFDACAFDCKVDADCSGGTVCDSFGRCSADDAGRIAGAQPIDRAPLSAFPSSFQTSVAGAKNFFRVYPRAQSSGPLKAIAEGQTLLWCPGAADPTPTCDLPAVGANGVELAIGFPAGGVVTLDVNTPSNNYSVAIVDDKGPVANVPLVAKHTPEPVTVGAASGAYDVLARVGDGGGLIGPIDVPGAEAQGQALLERLDAKVSVDDSLTGTIEIDDVAGLVLPQSPLTLAVAQGNVQWPALSWLLTGQTEALTQAVALPLTVSAGSFALTVPLQLAGLAFDDASVPFGGVTFSFTRATDLPQDYAPGAVTADAVATLDGGRARTGFAIGAQYAADAAAALTSSTVVGVLDGQKDSPLACAVDAASERLARIPAQCAAAHTSLGLNGAFASQSGRCPAVTAQMQADQGTGEIAFDCASDVTQFVGGLNGACRLPPYNVPNGVNQCIFDQHALTFLEDMQQCAAQCDTQVVSVSACAAAQQATGCALRAVNLPLAINDSERFNNAALSLTVTEQCVLPAFTPDTGPHNCLGVAACAQADFAAVTGYDTSASTTTGDAVCLDHSLPGALTALDDDLSDPDGVLDRCGADLQALAALTPADTALSAALVTSDGCFTAGNLLNTFDLATSALRANGPTDLANLGTAHRMVQAVAEMQALVARTALEQYRERITIEGDPDASSALDQLDTSIAGYTFLLDPRVTGALLAMPEDVLAAPDPRADLGVVNIAPQAQTAITQGVSISILDALSAQLELLDFTLERAWFEGSASVIADRRARIASLLHTGVVAATLAETLYDQAAQNGDPEFAQSYQTARLNYIVQLRHIADRSRAIDDGENPLGIEDVDLPLFFPGDVDGDRNRFTAISHFLVGTGPGSAAVAPLAVTQAQAALTAARADWQTVSDHTTDHDQREDDITRRFGELIVGECGGPVNDPGFDINAYNVLDTPIDPETCFLEPTCRPKPEDFAQSFTAGDLGFQLCMAAKLSGSLGGTGDQALDATLADVVQHGFLDGGDGDAFPITITDLQLTGGHRLAVATIAGVSETVSLDALAGVGSKVPPYFFSGGAATLLVQVRDACSARVEATQALRPAASEDASPPPTACSFADDCPRDELCATGACAADVPNARLDTADCYYDGQLSQQALAVRSAALEIEAARDALNDFSARYDIARKGCIITHNSGAALSAEITKHNDTMADLNAAKTALQAVAHAAGAVKDCTSTASGAVPDPGQASFAAASCGAAAAEAAADIGADVLDNFMAQATAKHEAKMQELQNKKDELLCYNDAELQMVGAKAQAVRVRQAQQAQAAAIINLRGAKSATAALWSEGNVALQKERDFFKRSVLGRFALSRAAELYTDRFAYAQRMTYVSVRAVEYEFQAPQAQARQAALAAKTPDDLEDVLRTLAAVLNDGTVNGSPPTGLLAVVSLKDHLLQLADKSTNPDGEQTLTDVERFRELL